MKMTSCITVTFLVFSAAFFVDSEASNPAFPPIHVGVDVNIDANRGATHYAGELSRFSVLNDEPSWLRSHDLPKNPPGKEDETRSVSMALLLSQMMEKRLEQLERSVSRLENVLHREELESISDQSREENFSFKDQIYKDLHFVESRLENKLDNLEFLLLKKTDVGKTLNPQANKRQENKGEKDALAGQVKDNSIIINYSMTNQKGETDKNDSVYYLVQDNHTYGDVTEQNFTSSKVNKANLRVEGNHLSNNSHVYFNQTESTALNATHMVSFNDNNTTNVGHGDQYINVIVQGNLQNNYTTQASHSSVRDSIQVDQTNDNGTVIYTLVQDNTTYDEMTNKTSGVTTEKPTFSQTNFTFVVSQNNTLVVDTGKVQENTTFENLGVSKGQTNESVDFNSSTIGKYPSSNVGDKESELHSSKLNISNNNTSAHLDNVNTTVYVHTNIRSHLDGYDSNFTSGTHGTYTHDNLSNGNISVNGLKGHFSHGNSSVNVSDKNNGTLLNETTNYKAAYNEIDNGSSNVSHNSNETILNDKTNNKSVSNEKGNGSVNVPLKNVDKLSNQQKSNTIVHDSIGKLVLSNSSSFIDHNKTNARTQSIQAQRKSFTEVPKTELTKHEEGENDIKEYPELTTCTKNTARSSGSTSAIITPDSSDVITDPYVCDQVTDGGGWIVIQRRINGNVGFNRNWDSYKKGFGYLSEDFWMGLDQIHAITNSWKYELRIEMTLGRKSAYALYDNFFIEDESKEYTLNLGEFVGGTAGDSLQHSDGKSFSTVDNDNDHRFFFNCAQHYKGGWWFTKECGDSNLNHNLHYYAEKYNTMWDTFCGDKPCTTTEMKIRRVE